MGGNNKRSGKQEAGRIITAVLFIIIVSCFLPLASSYAEDTISGLNLKQFNEKSTEGVSWSNNPFVQPASDVAVSELALTGIVYGNDVAAAILNDQIVKKGDKIGYNEIVDIGRTYLIVRNENGVFKLSLRGGS